MSVPHSPPRCFRQSPQWRWRSRSPSGVRGGPDSIDPHFTATGTHAETLKHVFDTLTWSGDGLEIEPRLATKLESNT